MSIVCGSGPQWDPTPQAQHIYITHGYDGHSINQHEALCFATNVVPHNNAGNAMKTDDNRDRHVKVMQKAYMHALQKVENALTCSY